MYFIILCRTDVNITTSGWRNIQSLQVQLQQLRLANCAISSSCASDLVKLLQSSNCCMRILELQSCDISYSVFCLLLDAIRNSSLTRFASLENNIDITVASKLADVLIKSPNLQEIEVTLNHVSIDVAVSLSIGNVIVPASKKFKLGCKGLIDKDKILSGLRLFYSFLFAFVCGKK